MLVLLGIDRDLVRGTGLVDGSLEGWFATRGAFRGFLHVKVRMRRLTWTI